jgi:hypothetical protein
MATVPLTGAPTSLCHSSSPVDASITKTRPVFEPTATLPSATTGVPVKSPCEE